MTERLLERFDELAPGPAMSASPAPAQSGADRVGAGVRGRHKGQERIYWEAPDE